MKRIAPWNGRIEEREVDAGVEVFMKVIFMGKRKNMKGKVYWISESDMFLKNFNEKILMCYLKPRTWCSQCIQLSFRVHIWGYIKIISNVERGIDYRDDKSSITRMNNSMMGLTLMSFFLVCETEEANWKWDKLVSHFIFSKRS